MAEVYSLKQEIEQQNRLLIKLRQRNEQLQAEVRDRKAELVDTPILWTWQTSDGVGVVEGDQPTTAESDIDCINPVELVRQLYRARSTGDSAAIHETKPQLRDSLERIIQAASAIKGEEA